MKGKRGHGYHMVDASPWPIVGAMGALTTAMGLVVYLQYGQGGLMCLGGVVLMGTAGVWWRDVVREGTYQGRHTRQVRRGLTYGVLLIIGSEAALILGLIWAYVHSSIAPSVETGMM